MRRITNVQIKYAKGNCEKNPFVVTFEAPLSGFDLHLVEFPTEIREDIINGLELVISEHYFGEIRAEACPCYT
jgi:hypothetical protein